MPTALLVGSFGQRNPGDEALADAFGRALPEWRMVTAASVPARAGDSASLMVNGRSAPAMARALHSCDAVIVAGGTVFKSLHPGAGRRPLAMLTKAVALTTAARALGKPFAMVGVGAGMLDSAMARRLARVLVRQTDLLVLRDEESAEVLAAAGAPAPFRIGTDPAWGLVETAERSSAAGGPVIVALSFLAGGPDLPSRLGAALAPLVEEGRDVRLQPWQVLDDGTVDDLGLAHAVNGHLPRPLPILDPPADLHAARDQFASAGLVLGLRFHSLVAAGAAGTPFVAVGHEPKLTAAARRLGQTAVPAGAAPDALTHAVREAIGGPRPSADAVAAEVVAAEETMDLLRVLLEGGDMRDDPAGIEGLPLRPAA